MAENSRDMYVKNARSLKRKARELLYAGQNHLELIISIIIAVTFCVVPIVACYLASEVIDENVLDILLMAIEIFISIPLFSGIYRMIGLAFKNKEYGLIDIFWAFSSIKNYFKVIFMNFISFLKTITPLSIGFILSTVAVEILGNLNIMHELAVAIGGMIMAVEVLLFLPLCSRFYAVRFLVTVEYCGVIQAVKYSWRLTKRNSVKLTLLNISLWPIALVSVVALLVPFIVYTLPFLICVYTVVCGKLVRADETEKLLIELQNDICPEPIAEGVEEINEQDS